MEGKNLKGNVVVHGVGVLDLFYNTPDLTGWEFVGQFTEIDAVFANEKVQLRFRNPGLAMSLLYCFFQREFKLHRNIWMSM